MTQPKDKRAWVRVGVNGASWTESSRRSSRPCSECRVMTRGRIEKKPYCIDCGMNRLLAPLRAVGSLIRGLAE
jgi:hypothetical protein